MVMATREGFQEKCLSASCRACGHAGLEPVLDLGMMPPSDALLPDEASFLGEKRYPLELAFCSKCSLAQILETVPPEELFSDSYLYFSSFSDALLEHSKQNALSLIEQRKLNKDSLVVELASNDGYLLKNFVESGVPVLGIDPAPNQAQAAIKIGVPTRNAFFTKELAKGLRAEGHAADVIIGNNVLAHVADTHGFIDGISILLKEDGIASIEAPYVRDLVDHQEFDTIYHEHLCYFSVTALDRLFRRHGMYINDVKRIPIHGGSLRIHIEKREAVKEGMRGLLAEEAELGIDGFQYFETFSRRVQGIRRELRDLLTTLKQEGRRIAAYGAAAKGTIMLNYIGADRELIDYVVDRNVHKHDKYMPGAQVPIRDTSMLLEDMPDYVLLLPWNFTDEILEQQAEYRKRGGHFIIPIPSVRVV